MTEQEFPKLRSSLAFYAGSEPPKLKAIAADLVELRDLMAKYDALTNPKERIPFVRCLAWYDGHECVREIGHVGDHQCGRNACDYEWAIRGD